MDETGKGDREPTRPGEGAGDGSGCCTGVEPGGVPLPASAGAWVPAGGGGQHDAFGGAVGKAGNGE